MTYAFNLTWDELPEDFKEDKITEYMENLIAEGEQIETDDEGDRANAEYQIKARFPIYF